MLLEKIFIKKLFFITPQPVENKGVIKKLKRKDSQYKKVNKSDLVYIAESPDYCEENDR